MTDFEGALRPDRMSPDERLVALMKGEPLDRVPFMPFILGFSARDVGISLASFYSDPEKSYQASLLTQQKYCCDNRPAFGYADYGAWEFGGEAKFPDSPGEQSIMVLRRPISTEEEAWELRLPDIRTAGYLPTQMAFTKVQVKYTGRASTPSGSTGSGTSQGTSPLLSAPARGLWGAVVARLRSLSGRWPPL